MDVTEGEFVCECDCKKKDFTKVLTKELEDCKLNPSPRVIQIKQNPSKVDYTINVIHDSVGREHWIPMYPVWSELSKRLESFRTWKVEGSVKIEDLALAGFFYQGEEDRLTCFFCGKVLVGWGRGNNPFKTHVDHSMICKYIKMIYVRIYPNMKYNM